MTNEYIKNKVDAIYNLFCVADSEESKKKEIEKIVNQIYEEGFQDGEIEEK